MTITKTVGTGGDFSDINAAVSWFQSNAVSGGNLTDHVVINIRPSGITISSTQTISGWAPGGSNFTTTLGADSASPGPFGAPLIFNTARGYYIDGAGNNVGVVASVDLFTMQDLQLRPTNSTPGYGAYALDCNGATDGTVNILRCIIDAYTATAMVKSPAASGINPHINVKNSLFVQRRNSATSGCIGDNIGTIVSVQDCTFVAANSGTGGSGASAVGPNNYTSVTSTGCVYVNWINDYGHTAADTSGDHNATTNSGFTTSNGETTSPASSQVSINLTTEFQGGSGLTDMRLASGSTQLKDHGVTISGITADIYGTARSGTPDIGAYEVASAPSARHRRSTGSPRTGSRAA